MPMLDVWDCHVCGDERPDDVIGVFKVDTSAENGLPPGTMVQNIRYCTDKPECVIGARSYRHVQPPKEVSNDPDATG